MLVVTGELRGPGGGPPLGLFDKTWVITVLVPVMLGAFQVLSLNNSELLEKASRS